ncbi:hypothetical protein TrRE_jg6319 [Triparma retinervis]|uniref:Palmitoyltransferase n=1 Tax=Triparma retinervis TaxID=2557542 RepID=A0A9W6ZM14_9STRA|nr:hypothetical protein TrRE_jg6319 [Triparma retinervis]
MQKMSNPPGVASLNSKPNGLDDATSDDAARDLENGAMTSVTIDSLAVELNGNPAIPPNSPPPSTPLFTISDDVESGSTDAPSDSSPWPRRDSSGRIIYATVGKYESRLSKGLKSPRPYPRLQACCCVSTGLAKYYVGNMPVLLSNPDGSPRLIMGSWWPFCVGITVPLIAGAVTIVAALVLVPMAPLYITLLYFALVAVTLGALFSVSCRNPGLVSKREKVVGPNVSTDSVDRSKWIWNDRVKSFRPRGALYCDTNDVVVEEYDHFCPWTGTSIGGGNMQAFKVFVVAVNVLCYTTVGVVILVVVLW